MKTMTSFSRDHGFVEEVDEELDFSAIARSAEFTRLRSRILRFVLPMTALFLTWYLVYVLLAAYAPEFMSIRVGDNITMGLVLGLSQFATTVAIMIGYLVFARRRIDPAVAQLRERAGKAAR